MLSACYQKVLIETFLFHAWLILNASALHVCVVAWVNKQKHFSKNFPEHFMMAYASKM